MFQFQFQFPLLVGCLVWCGVWWCCVDDDGLFNRTDPQFRNKFTNTYTSPGVNVPWYPCLGNHDYYQDPTAELNRANDDPRWYFPSKYYNFSYHLEDGSEVLFVVLDVNP